MKVSYDWLQSFFSSSLPPAARIADLLTLHSVEVEHTGKREKDRVLTLDVLPNRSHDLLSHRGVAREVAALLNIKIKNKKSKPQTKKQKVSPTRKYLDVQVKDSDLCPRYTARVIKGVKIGPSPRWIRERLEAVGIRTITNVVDATNYIMMELGQPLHAFDLDKLDMDRGGSIRGSMRKSIVVRRAKKGEKIITLDDEERMLDNSMLVIADSRRPIALAGIMGGRNTEVDTNTKNLILESAVFDAKNIRKTTRAFELESESSMRFASGIDPALARKANDALAALIQEVAGGETSEGVIDVSLRKQIPRTVLLHHGRIESLLGLAFKTDDIRQILSRLGFGVRQKKKTEFLVTVPSFRGDVVSEEDLIEEIGRVYGYEKITPDIPVMKAIPPPEDDSLVIADTIRNILAGLGYNETYSYSFVGEDDISAIRDNISQYVAVQNPMSSDFAYLTKSLLIPFLKHIRLNQKYFEHVKLFELGTVYGRETSFGGKTRLAIGLAVKRTEPAREEFYILKGVIENVLTALGIAGVSYREFGPGSSSPSYFHPAISAEVLLREGSVGFIGEVKRDILEGFKIEGRMVFADVDFDRLVSVGARDTRYRALPKYPPFIQDIAVLVDLDTRVEEVLNVINGAGGELVADVDLFDMYEGEELPDGKKNLAFHIIYQAPDRTLSQKEVDNVHEKIAKALEEEIGGEVRK